MTMYTIYALVDKQLKRASIHYNTGLTTQDLSRRLSRPVSADLTAPQNPGAQVWYHYLRRKAGIPGPKLGLHYVGWFDSMCAFDLIPQVEILEVVELDADQLSAYLGVKVDEVRAAGFEIMSKTSGVVRKTPLSAAPTVRSPLTW